VNNECRAQKQVLSGHPGQVDSPSGQVTFHSQLLDGQGLTQVIYQLNHLSPVGDKDSLVASGQCVEP